MSPSSADDFTRRYFDDWQVAVSGDRAERLALRDAEDRPSDVLHDMFHMSNEPERAWPLILKLIEDAPSDEALAFVAAGPLEDLIRTSGDEFEDRIVERGQGDARFRRALGGVWGWEDVSASLRDRVFELLGVPRGNTPS